MYSLQYRPQMDHTQYPENGERWRSRCPPLSSYLLWSICGLYCRLHMVYEQLMYGPYRAMYDLHITHIAFRSAISSAIRSAQRTDHQGTLAKKSVICYCMALYDSTVSSPTQIGLGNGATYQPPSLEYAWLARLADGFNGKLVTS